MPLRLARPFALALVAAVSVLAAACGGGSAGGDGAALADGRWFGYIRSVDTSASPPTISVDVAEFLTGDEAQKAAVEDGVIEEGEPVPNDYYVRNPDSAEAVVPVASDVAVTRVDCDAGCTEATPGSFEPFAASFAIAEPTLEDDYRGSSSQYWVTVDGGEVTAIDEQYVP